MRSHPSLLTLKQIKPRTDSLTHHENLKLTDYRCDDTNVRVWAKSETRTEETIDRAMVGPSTDEWGQAPAFLQFSLRPDPPLCYYAIYRSVFYTQTQKNWCTLYLLI